MKRTSKNTKHDGAGLLDSMKSVGKKCGEIYSNRYNSEIQPAYNALSTAKQDYIQFQIDQGIYNPTDGGVSERAFQLYSLIQLVNDKNKDSRDCLSKDIDVKAFANRGTLTYNGLIDDFLKEARGVTVLLDGRRSNVPISKSDNGERGENVQVYSDLMSVLSRLDTLVRDIKRTIGLDENSSILKNISQVLELDIRDILAVYDRVADTSDETIQQKFERLFAGTTFSQKHYSAFISLLARLYLSISRKKFVLSYDYSYYYVPFDQGLQNFLRLSESPTPNARGNDTRGGSKKSRYKSEMKSQSAGALESVFHANTEFTCGTTTQIIGMINTKIQHLVNILKISTNVIQSVNLTVKGNSLKDKLLYKLKPSMPFANRNVSGTVQKVGELYVTSQLNMNLAPESQIVIGSSTSDGVYIFDYKTKMYQKKKNATDTDMTVSEFVVALQKAINMFIELMIDEKDILTVLRNYQVSNVADVLNQSIKDKYGIMSSKTFRLTTLGIIADLIEFFQFKIMCTSRRGGGSSNMVQMTSKDGVVYNVPKSQAKYFSSVGFVLSGGDDNLLPATYTPNTETNQGNTSTSLPIYSHSTYHNPNPFGQSIAGVTAHNFLTSPYGSQNRALAANLLAPAVPAVATGVASAAVATSAYVAESSSKIAENADDLFNGIVTCCC